MNHSPEMTVAIRAAKSAGAFLKKHFYDRKKVDEASQNDIKLELDKLSQKLITRKSSPLSLLTLYWGRKVTPETGTAKTNGSWTPLTAR